MLEIDKNGNRRWKNEKGELHREDVPAIEYVNGTKCWYLDGNRHREDGPAIEYADGGRCWCRNGNRHRINGPAIEWSDGSEEYWIEGVKYTEAEYKMKVKEIC
jgi:hypothetical protein